MHLTILSLNQDLKKAISLPYRMDDQYDANSVINAGEDVLY